MTEITRQAIKEEIDKLEPGNGVQFITGDEVYNEGVQWEYFSTDLGPDDMPHIIYDIDLLTELIFQNIMNDNSLKQ